LGGVSPASLAVDDTAETVTRLCQISAKSPQLRPQPTDTVVDPSHVRAKLSVALVVAAFVAGGCAGSNRAEPEADASWTIRQAESVTSVRGLRVRVRYCRGLGHATRSDNAARYRRFECLAGARAASDPYAFDTVAVLYDLEPLADYDGPESRHRLADVQFIGGPGIP
jgi:hypothetical protein